MKIRSVSDMLAGGVTPMNIPELLVKGPKEIDCNVRSWQRGDSIGIIGSSGVGKTSFLLWIFKEILLNNPEGFCVFTACEMSRNQILAKWQKATKDCPEISDRFYIITSHDDEGKREDLSIRGIKKKLLEYRSVLNQELLAHSIDHLHIVHRDDNESLDSVVYSFSKLNTELSTLGFLTSQTTKGKSAGGEIPLDKDASYGCSAYTWELSYIYTVCQPLIRLQDKINLPVTGWNIAKNRFKEREDERKEAVNYLLKFKYEDESYKELTQDELLQFAEFYNEVVALRDAEDKKKMFLFDTSYKVKSSSGKDITINRKVGYSKTDDNGWD